MTPRKAKQRQVQPNAANPVSDYESDFNNPTLDEQPLPPPARTNTELNLSVIKRHLPDAVSIVSIASYAVVYIFSLTSQQWEKNGVEGTLFICELSPNPSATPRYSVLILNRRGMDNFKLELLDSDDVDITEEYVILQGHDDADVPKAYGLWIFSEPEPSSTAHAREVNARIIEDCALRAERGRITTDRQQHVNGFEIGKSNAQSDFSRQQVQGSQSIGRVAAQPATSDFHQSNPTENKNPPDVLGELFRKATQSYRGSN